MKNMQYNPYLWANRRNFLVLKEISVEEHDGDVKWRGNMAVSCMHIAQSSKPSLIKHSVIAMFENYATECSLFG